MFWIQIQIQISVMCPVAITSKVMVCCMCTEVHVCRPICLVIEAGGLLESRSLRLGQASQQYIASQEKQTKPIKQAKNERKKNEKEKKIHRTSFIYTSILKMKVERWRDRAVVKSTCGSCQEPGFYSQHPHISLQHL